MSKIKSSKNSRVSAKIKVLITKNSGSDVWDKNKRDALSKIKRIIPFKEVENIVSWIKSKENIKKLFFSFEFPRSFNDLEPYYFLSPAYDESEFRWTGAFLLNHVSSLKKFVH